MRTFGETREEVTMQIDGKCAVCGAELKPADYFEQISRKYCPDCAAVMARKRKREWAARYRQLMRERRALLRQLCTAQEKENARLRAIIEQMKGEKQ